MLTEKERPEVLHQVATEPNEDGSRLAFQEYRVTNRENPCYTFVWIKNNEKMSVLGRVQISDIGTIFELLIKAVAEGWLDLKDYKRKIQWGISLSSIEE